MILFSQTDAGKSIQNYRKILIFKSQFKYQIYNIKAFLGASCFMKFS